MTFVDVKNVSHVFTKIVNKETVETCAVEHVNLQVSQDEFLVMLGPSGCGKTTLLRLINGLVKPTEGEIFVQGKKVESPSLDRAMVFQTFSLFPWKNTLENVAFGLEIQNRPEEERFRIAQKNIDLVGLNGFETHYPHELSGGMKQRVGIARALTVNPKILLMDEPFGSIDALTRMSIQLELLDLWEKLKKTIIFITHDLDESIFLADRVVLMSARPGRIKKTYKINLPRPRRHDIKNSAEFQKIRLDIWNDLKMEL
ncbi:MAG: ABC transporter ATP-binding protein [Candidatus Heimdallarchaeaceae archaeon]